MQYYHTTDKVRVTMEFYLSGLFLEGIQDTVDELLLQPAVDIGSSQVAHCLLDTLHHHLPVLLILVFKVVDDSVDDLGRPDFVGDLDGRVDQLTVVAAVEGHSVIPEVFEEVRQNLIFDVLRLHTIGSAALLHYLLKLTKLIIKIIPHNILYSTEIWE